MNPQSGITESIEFEPYLSSDEIEELRIWDVTLLDGLDDL